MFRLFVVFLFGNLVAAVPVYIDWTNEKPEDLVFSQFRIQIDAESDAQQWNLTVPGNVSRMEFDSPLGPSQLHRVQIWAESDSDVELLIADKFIFPGVPLAGPTPMNIDTSTIGSPINNNGQPQNLQVIKEGLQLRISWSKPPAPECSSYLVNYTIVTLSIPKSFALDTRDTYVLIKFLKGHLIKLQIYCISDTMTVAEIPLEGFADLRIPMAVQNFRLTEAETDDFFRAKVGVIWDSLLDYPMEEFTVVLSYFQGKVGGTRYGRLNLNPAIVEAFKAQKTRKDIIWHKGDVLPVNITSLIPTETYTFTVRNISRLGLESPLKTIRHPMPPIISSSLYPGKTTSQSLIVNFSPTDVDQAKFDSYFFQFGFNRGLNFSAAVNRDESRNSFKFDDLKPGETYEATVYTVFQGVFSRPVVANFTTYPLKIKNLMPIVRRDSIKLYWEPEDPLPGIQYRLQLTGSDGFEAATVLTSDTNHLFTNLKPEIWYTVDLTVLVADTESESESRTVVTGFNRPRFPILEHVGATSVTITIERDIITESNGALTSHAVIITEDTKLDTFIYVLPSWYEVQNSEVWPPYQATGRNYDPFRSRKENSVTIPIGTEDCRLHLETFCNGPLKPLTQYHLKIRACTKDEICMETEYTKFTTYSEDMLKKKNEAGHPRHHGVELLLFLLLFIVSL